MSVRHRDEQALSPVVGVILLVAITVVLSASVFYAAGKISEDRAKSAPPLGMSTDETAGEARVIHADPDLDWFDDMVVAGSCTPLLNGGAFPVASGTPVKAGDILSCDAGESLTLSSSQAEGNSLLYRNSFP